MFAVRYSPRKIKPHSVKKTGNKSLFFFFFPLLALTAEENFFIAAFGRRDWHDAGNWEANFTSYVNVKEEIVLPSDSRSPLSRPLV